MEELVEEMPLITISDKAIYSDGDWIVDFVFSNHKIEDEEKLLNKAKYKGECLVVTTNNSRLLVAYIEKTTVVPRFGQHQVQMDQFYHVLG